MSSSNSQLPLQSTSKPNYTSQQNYPSNPLMSGSMSPYTPAYSPRVPTSPFPAATFQAMLNGGKSPVAGMGAGMYGPQVTQQAGLAGLGGLGVAMQGMPMGGFGMGLGMNMGMGGFNGYQGQGGPQMQAQIQQPLVQLPPGGMDPAMMTGNYGPAAAAAAAAAVGNTTGRTVYVGNLPPDASVDELMNLVRFGPIESVRLLPEKSCVFISFLDGATSAAFHADASVKKLTLHGQELKIGWGKPSIVPQHIVEAIRERQATRNCYLGGLDKELTEGELRDDLMRFGPIDQVKIVRDKGIGFVHFLSIATAMKVVATLPTEEAWQGKRVGYGKDRCAYVPRAQQAAVAAAQQQAAAALGHTLGLPGSPFQAFSVSSPQIYNNGFHSPVFSQGSPFIGGAGAMMNPGNVGMDPQEGNRCVYLGSLAEEATTEDVCNAVRGGMLLHVRYLKEKHMAFVTFVDPISALNFHTQASNHGLLIAGKRAKVGWGKPTERLNANMVALVQGQASRVVYIGGMEDWEVWNEEKLRVDFGEFGETEQINFLKEKKAAFVNFCALANAAKAIDNIKHRAEYKELRVAYGKDRCANAARPGHFGVTGRTRNPSANDVPPAGPPADVVGENVTKEEEPLEEGEIREDTK